MFLMPDNKWARLLAYITGLVNQKLLLQNEYLAAENRILRAHLPARMRLSDPERSTLAEIGRRLGRTALQQVACVAKPDTISQLLSHEQQAAQELNQWQTKTGHEERKTLDATPAAVALASVLTLEQLDELERKMSGQVADPAQLPAAAPLPALPALVVEVSAGVGQ